MAKAQVFIGAAGFSGTGAHEVRFSAAQSLLSGDTDGDGIADYQITFKTGNRAAGYRPDPATPRPHVDTNPNPAKSRVWNYTFI